MNLEITKKILQRYVKQNGSYLRNAILDIKPDYSEKGIGMKHGEGHSYAGFEGFEIDFIYNSIRELCSIVNDHESAVQFNIDYVFITEKKALNELKEVNEYVKENYLKLKKIEEKYKGIECSYYPLNVCLISYKKIIEILDEIFESTEVKEFEQPNKTFELVAENEELKFNIFWRKRKWIYIIHFLAFIPFVIGIIEIILHKDDKAINGINKTIILILSGIMTILFNLFFNNHNSFKDSFKLLLSKSRIKLKEKEKEEFLKSINQK